MVATMDPISIGVGGCIGTDSVYNLVQQIQGLWVDTLKIFRDYSWKGVCVRTVLDWVVDWHLCNTINNTFYNENNF